MNKSQFKKGHIPWNKNQIKTTCLTCQRSIYLSQSRYKQGRGKFCNQGCRGKHKYKLAQEIKLTPKIAELIGVIIGDGCVNKNYRRPDYRIQISGNPVEDKDYMENHLPKLLYESLGIKKKPYIGKNGAYIIQFQSEPFRIFLHSLGIKSPKENITIPQKIQREESLLQPCIKGIADSDFTFICTKRGKDKPDNYPRICAQFYTKRLVKDLEICLRKMGFTLNTKYDYLRKDKRGFESTTNFINLDGPHNLKKWLKLIGFSNPRIITRYQIWQRFKELKPKSTIIDRKKLLG